MGFFDHDALGKEDRAKRRREIDRDEKAAVARLKEVMAKRKQKESEKKDVKP